VLHRHVVPIEVAPPRSELIRGDAERDVNRAVGAVGGQGFPFAAGGRVKDVHYPDPAAEGDVIALGTESNV